MTVACKLICPACGQHFPVEGRGRVPKTCKPCRDSTGECRFCGKTCELRFCDQRCARKYYENRDTLNIEWLPYEPLLGRSLSEVARAGGVDYRTAKQWKRVGRLPAGRADRVATRLGMHPCELWDEWWQ